MDYLCAKFGDFSFSRFGFIVRQTDRQTESQRNAADRCTPIGVSNKRISAAHRAVSGVAR